MKQKIILFFIVTCVVAAVVISLALVTIKAYPGSETSLSATDVRILRGGISSVWCDGQTIQSDDGITFNASVVPGNPRINPNTRHKKSIKLSEIPLTPSNSRVYWRFYLPAGSYLHISQCAKTDKVMGYVLRGHDVVEGCIYYSLKHLLRTLRSHNNCTDIWMSREIVRTCRGSKQMIDISISNDDYYLVLYQSSNSDDTFVSVNITLDTPTYDLSNSIANCSSDQECTLPLTFDSDDTVVASLLANITSKDSTLEWTCHIRPSIYFIVFLAIPLLIGVIIGTTIVCCSVRRKSSGDPPVVCNEPIEEPRDVDCETEPLLGGRGKSLLPPAIDPRLRDMGPIPGPSLYPTNLPTAPPEDGGDQPFNAPLDPVYPPPPPSYEETMRSDEREGENRSERVAEKC